MSKWKEKTEVDIDAFWSPEDKAVIEGTVVDARVFRDKETGESRLMWVIETSAETKGRKKGETEGTNYPAGSIIAVGHRAKLAPLLKDYMIMHSFDVRIAPLEKRKLGKKHMWMLRYAMRGGESRPVALTPAQVAPETRQLSSGKPAADDADYEDTEELPF